MASQLPDKLTPLTPEEAVKAIADGYKQVTGRKPSKKVLALLIGQTALETGNWTMMHNYNFGNMKLGKADSFFQVYRVGDDPTDPGAKYAAFQNAADGAAAYIAIFKRPDRQHWWDGLQSGNIDAFIKGLTTAPVYFTADASHYTGVLANRLAKYQDLANKYGASTVLQIATGIVLGVAALASIHEAKKRI